MIHQKNNKIFNFELFLSTIVEILGLFSPQKATPALLKWRGFLVEYIADRSDPNILGSLIS